MGSDASKSTEEFYEFGEDHDKGPDLLMPRRSHCAAVETLTRDLWLIGGRVGDYENANYSGLMTDGNVKL